MAAFSLPDWLTKGDTTQLRNKVDGAKVRGRTIRCMIVSPAGPDTSIAHLLPKLRDAISAHPTAEARLLMAHAGPLRRKLGALLPGRKRLAALARTDVLIVHTALMMSAADILVARLLGRRVCAIYWDSYPDSFRRPWSDRSSLMLGLMGIVERFLLRRCDLILPPSEDYLTGLEKLGVGDRTHVLPMWPFTETDAPRATRPTEGLARVVFAGQVNHIRGLDHACAVLANAAHHCPVELHIYGDASNWIPPDAGKNLTIFKHGRVPQETVSAALSEFDFGLVSLHPDFDSAAFPSKSVSLIAAGLPILYIGPDLPAYGHFLESCGVGTTMTADATFDLSEASSRHRADLPDAQKRALQALGIDRASIQAILATD